MPRARGRRLRDLHHSADHCLDSHDRVDYDADGHDGDDYANHDDHCDRRHDDRGRRVENRTDAEKLVDAEVLEGDETLVGGRFRVPANVGLRFDRRFEWGEYAVRGRVAGGDWQSMKWTPGSCAATPHEDGNMNAGVVVSGDGVSVVHNVCDYLRLGQVYVAEYRPASDYRVETTSA